jgi:hypothetical protein
MTTPLSIHLHPPNKISEIKSCLKTIHDTRSLYNENNFNTRIETIDFITYDLLPAITLALQKTNHSAELTALHHDAEKAKSHLEKINATLFEHLRENIRHKKYQGNDFRNILHQYVGLNSDSHQEKEIVRYDNLDIFMNGLLSFLPMPDATKDLAPEMVPYQKTPARVILDLLDKAQFTHEDIFVDLGAGLGQVAMMVNLLSNVAATGIEFEPAFCRYARACATQLDLPNVTFINADAREADYAKGTVFFMYTPFEGQMLQTVLDRLKNESRSRNIRIFTYGPCTADVARQNWLDFSKPNASNLYALNMFCSR